ncbi:MAG: hypothetical protein EOM24_00770 [Chloroflexia bacterium]|nr:hypothetical protein [Chloroflexia bacterium]
MVEKTFADFFRCTLCMSDAQVPMFGTEDEMVMHLDTSHDVPAPYFTKFRDLAWNERIYVTQLDIVDGNGQIVGDGQMVMKR